MKRKQDKVRCSMNENVNRQTGRTQKMKDKYEEAARQEKMANLMNAPETSVFGIKGTKKILIGLVFAVAMMVPYWAFAAVPAVDNATGATNLTSNSAILNGTLTSTGGVTTELRVYWGLADGVTTIGNWGHVAVLGTKTVGPWSVAVTGLTPNQTYFYRFYATNLSGNVWASSTSSFLTPAMAGPLPIDLGTTSHFTILAGAAITYPGAGTVTGDVGASPITGAAISIPPVQVNGIIYKVDAAGPIGGNVIQDAGLLTTAKGDLTIAYNAAANRVPVPAGPFRNPGAGNIGGMSLVPGLYKFDGGALISGSDVTLTGGPDDVWIFQIATTLTVEAGLNRKVILAGGARAKNIFWQVGSSATLGTYSVFKGTILADQAITMNLGSTLDGRALAFSAGVAFGGGSGVLPSNNNAPVAAPDAYSVTENTIALPTILTVATPGVLGNDSDADANPITAVKVTDPTHGVLTLNANGSFTYVPTVGYSGPDSFTYKANDGLLNSNTVTVTITVNATFTLTVINGTGSGVYVAGTLVPIIATIPVGKVFSVWTGDIANLASSTNATTTAAMPAANIIVTAVFVDAPPGTYTLTVINGTGSGSYTPVTAVPIAAVAPPGKVFSVWTGDIASLANPADAATIATMPAANIAVTAVFTDAPAGTYTLTVVNGSGSGAYLPGTAVTITAIAPAGKVFSVWTGDTGYLASSTASPTIATMEDVNIIVTAVFIDAPVGSYTLTVVNGTGSGAYLPGTAVTITAIVPAGKYFDSWAGDIANIVDFTASPTIAAMPSANITVTAIFANVAPVTANNMYLAYMRASINWAKHDTGISDDRLYLNGQVNPLEDISDLSSATVLLSVNGVQLLPAVTLDSHGNAKGEIDGVHYLFKFDWRRGFYIFHLRGLDLRVALGVPNATAKILQNIPVSLTIAKAELEIPLVIGTFASPCTTTVGKTSKITFSSRLDSTLTGLYNCNRTTVWGSGVKVTGVIEANGGGQVVPTGDITVKVGGATMVIPLADVVIKGSKWSYRSTAPGITRFNLDNRNHTFYMLVSRMEGIGIPISGPSEPLQYRLPVQLKIPTASGDMAFYSIIEILRLRPTTRTWIR